MLPAPARARVRLLGFRRLAEVPDLYRASDVLVFPSRYDGWGMTLMEGMAAAQPVISTEQTGSAYDVIRDGENGFLLPRAEPALVAGAMRTLLEDPERVRRMGCAARRTAERYTHRAGARAFLDRIHAAAGPAPAAAGTAAVSSAEGKGA